jgi:hypothetical protein
MTKKAYWAIFGTLNWPSDYGKLLETPDHVNAKKYGMEKSEMK